MEDFEIGLSENEDKAKFDDSITIVSKYMDTIASKTKPTIVPKRMCFSVGDANDQTLINPSVGKDIDSTSSDNIADSDLICPDPATVNSLKYLWSCPCIQKAYERRNEFTLIDSAAYFLNDLDRLCAHDYEPTDDDILRSRVKTVGIVKLEFSFRHLTVSEN